MRTIAVLFAIALGAPAHLACALEPTNALWNDSGAKGFVGVWIYPVSGECPELRARAKPLVFAIHALGGTFEVSQLQYCFQLPESYTDKLVSCKSGSVRLELDSPSQRYKGDYSFEMADGSRRNGTFSAQFCAKGSLWTMW